MKGAVLGSTGPEVDISVSETMGSHRGTKKGTSSVSLSCGTHDHGDGLVSWTRTKGHSDPDLVSALRHAGKVLWGS